GTRIVGDVDVKRYYSPIHVFDVASRTYERVAESAANARFPDSRHLIMETERGIELLDLDTSTLRVVIPQPRRRGYGTPTVSSDGRWFLWTEIDFQADIWLATPQNPAAAKP